MSTNFMIFFVPSEHMARGHEVVGHHVEPVTKKQVTESRRNQGKEWSDQRLQTQLISKFGKFDRFSRRLPMKCRWTRGLL